MKYKVFFHKGPELGLKTKVSKGRAWLDETAFHLEGPAGFTVPLTDIVRAELFRLHGLGRVIRVETRGGSIFVAVVRLMIGQFAFINFFKTGALQKQLAAAASLTGAALSIR